jgi:hypothetical protein
MNAGIDRKATTWLFNPFVYIAGAQALGLGLVAILVAGFIGSMSNTHFDGVLDTHTGMSAPIWFFLAAGFIDWFCLAIVLLVFGKIISKTAFRTIDLFGTQALARWPTILVSLVMLPPAIQRFSHELLAQVTNPGVPVAFNSADAVIFFASTALLLVLLCWEVYLMYKSYSVSCNVKGGLAIGTFIAAQFLAEVLSKIAIYSLLRLV